MLTQAMLKRLVAMRAMLLRLLDLRALRLQSKEAALLPEMQGGLAMLLPQESNLATRQMKKRPCPFRKSLLPISKHLRLCLCRPCLWVSCPCPCPCPVGSKMSSLTEAMEGTAAVPSLAAVEPVTAVAEVVEVQPGWSGSAKAKPC